MRDRAASTAPTGFAAQIPDRASPVALKQVVYVSRDIAAHHPETLRDILKTARLKNRANHITGMLVHFDGRFLQYLEGPVLSINRTMSRIAADPRHQDVEVLLDGPVDQRRFQRWDMGSVEVGSTAWRRLVEADWPTIRPLARNRPAGLEVLQELAELPSGDAAPADRPRMLGDRHQEAPASQGEINPDDIADQAPELWAIRLQLIGVAVIALFAILLLLRLTR